MLIYEAIRIEANVVSSVQFCHQKSVVESKESNLSDLQVAINVCASRTLRSSRVEMGGCLFYANASNSPRLTILGFIFYIRAVEYGWGLEEFAFSLGGQLLFRKVEDVSLVSELNKRWLGSPLFDRQSTESLFLLSHADNFPLL